MLTEDTTGAVESEKRNAASVSESVPLPEFVRLPAHGHRCPYTSLGSSYLYKLLRQGTIKGAVLRHPGGLRGVRLIHLPSLLEFLRRAMETPLPPIRPNRLRRKCSGMPDQPISDLPTTAPP